MSDAFENKIREKLNQGEGEIPFDAEAWNKMESKLNALDNDGRRRTAWWWLGGLLLLLGTGGLLWWHAATKNLAPLPQEKDMAAATPGSGSKTGTGTLQDVKEDSKSSVTPLQDTKQQNAGSQEVRHSSEIQQAKIQGAKTQEINAQRSPRGTAVATGPTLPLTVMPKGKGGMPAVTGLSLDAAVKGYSTGNIGLHILQVKDVYNGNVYTGIKGPVATIPVKPLQDTSLPSQNKAVRKGWALGLMLGPDFNIAPSLKYGRIGWNMGLLAHYYVNNLWYFTTGAVYSKKLYGATPKDYQGSRNYGVTKVKADCNVLDVPVNVNYTFLDRSGQTLSATAGFSNYFMLREKYEYYYNNGPSKERVITNENRHYLALLNLGLTYQVPLGARTTLGVQPYAKVPLKGVGAGAVKLYTAGVALQLNFNGFPGKIVKRK